MLLPRADKRLPGTRPVFLRQTIPVNSGESPWMEGPSLTCHCLPLCLWALGKDPSGGQAALGAVLRVGTEWGLQGQQGLDIFGGELRERISLRGEVEGKQGLQKLSNCSLSLPTCVSAQVIYFSWPRVPRT